jgi:hypothetical protein
MRSGEVECHPSGIDTAVLSLERGIAASRPSGKPRLRRYPFGQRCELEEPEPEVDVVDVDADPEEDDEPPLAAFARAAPPTAIAPTTRSAARIFCIRVITYHLPSSSVTLRVNRGGV